MLRCIFAFMLIIGMALPTEAKRHRNDDLNLRQWAGIGYRLFILDQFTRVCQESYIPQDAALNVLNASHTLMKREAGPEKMKAAMDVLQREISPLKKSAMPRDSHAAWDEMTGNVKRIPEYISQLREKRLATKGKIRPKVHSLPGETQPGDGLFFMFYNAYKLAESGVRYVWDKTTRTHKDEWIDWYLNEKTSEFESQVAFARGWRAGKAEWNENPHNCTAIYNNFIKSNNRSILVKIRL